MARLRNEEYFVYQGFFDGFDAPLLRAAFGDLMVNPDATAPEDLAVEQALLYFRCESDAQSACWTVGLERMFALLGQPASRPALQAYGIDEAWLHERMAVFSPFLPEDAAQPSAEPVDAPGRAGLLGRLMRSLGR